MLDENQLEKLIKQLEAITNTETAELSEPNHKEFFNQAIWTVENIDEAVKSRLENIGAFLPSEGSIRHAKVDTLNSICEQVSEVWETINDGSELEDLGERALILACNALDKLNALS